MGQREYAEERDMSNAAIATASAEGHIERYRQAERAVWNRYGLAPTERFIELASPAVRLRVLEVGSGEPILFLHGTVGPGAWPALVRELSGFRCLLLDRPGWGLSSELDYAKHDYATVIADLSRGVLDALGVDRAHVVGGSIGDLWALRIAQRHPSRVGRVVLLGGGPIVAEIEPPKFIKIIASPIGAVMVRLPDNAARLRSILQRNGHGASLADGRIPDEFIAWALASSREIGPMRAERAMVRTIVNWRSGWRPGLTVERAELGRIEQPTLMVYGTADPVGSVEVWQRMLGAVPHGKLTLIDGAGHMPWFDDPGEVGGQVRAFLAG
jgi:2-hydroxy-6-oxonona-2,4-dienedioate hydrolase